MRPTTAFRKFLTVAGTETRTVAPDDIEEATVLVRFRAEDCVVIAEAEPPR